MSTWTCSRSATWTFVFYARRGGRFARRRTPSEGRETRSRTRRTPPRTPPPAPSPSSPWTNASPSSTRSSGEGKVPTGRVPTGRAPTGRVPTGRGSTGRVPTGCPSMGTPSTGYPRSVECPPRRDTLGTPTRCTPRPKQRRPPPSDSPPSSSTRTPARHPRRALRDRETHALLPRRAYDDPRDERRKPHDRPLRLGAADLAESAILRAMLRDGKYEEMLEFARRVEPPTDPTDGGDGGGDVPLGNRALAEADATATAARRAVVATAREHLGDDAKANEAADVVERAEARRGRAMTPAGLLRTDRGEDPRGDVGESAALVDPSSVLADALRRFGDDADAAVAAAAAAESRATAEAFRARALGDAAAAEARALAADRARLLEIIDAERGAYPLAANPAAAAEAAEKEAREGASKKASEAAFWGDVGLDDDEGEREETPEERDAREREERAKEAEEARRRARDERFAKLERWARSGVDLSAYDEADEGGSNANGDGDGEQSRRRGRRPDAGHSASELLAFRARVAAALEDTESRLASDAFLERRAGAPKEAPNGASSETSKEEAHAASKEEAWLCRLRASLLETRADVDEALARADVDPRDADVDPRDADVDPRDSGRRPQTLKTAAARASVENVADVDAAPSEVGVPIGTPAFARVGTLSPVEDATEVPSEASPPDASSPDASSPKASPPRNRWAAALARAREKPPRKNRPARDDERRWTRSSRRTSATRSPRTRRAREDDVPRRRRDRRRRRRRRLSARRKNRPNRTRRRARTRVFLSSTLATSPRPRPSRRSPPTRTTRAKCRFLFAPRFASPPNSPPRSPRGRGEIPGTPGPVARRVPAGRRFRFPSRSRRDRESRPRLPGGHGVRTGVGASRNSRSRGARPPSRANPGPRSRRRRRGGGRPDTRRGGGGCDSQSRRRRTAHSLRRRYRERRQRRRRRQYHDRTKTRGCIEPGTRVRSRGRGREASRRTRDASARDARVVDDRKGTFAKPSAGDGRGRTRRRASPRAHATHPRRVTR